MCSLHCLKTVSFSTCISTVLSSYISIRIVSFLGVGFIRFIWSQKMWCIVGPPSCLQRVTHGGSMRPLGFSAADQHSVQYNWHCKEETNNHPIMQKTELPLQQTWSNQSLPCRSCNCSVQQLHGPAEGNAQSLGHSLNEALITRELGKECRLPMDTADVLVTDHLQHNVATARLLSPLTVNTDLCSEEVTGVVEFLGRLTCDK